MITPTNDDEQKARSREQTLKRRREAAQRHRKNNPEKIRARKKISEAIRRGWVNRPDACVMCGVKCIPVAHHSDYSRPRFITWLCEPCHNAHHLRERKMKALDPTRGALR